MKNQEPRSSSSCAACKFLKRRCTPTCQFAPYFRSDESTKFSKVHKVFGASNVSKILNEVPEDQREETVNSLVFEAELRLQDPVYGCIGAIASLQNKMMELQHDLVIVQSHLACYAAGNHQPSNSYFGGHVNVVPSVGLEGSSSSEVVESFGHNPMPFDHDQFSQFNPFP